MDFISLLRAITLTKEMICENVSTLMVPISNYLSKDESLIRVLDQTNKYQWALGSRYATLLQDVIPKGSYYLGKASKKTPDPRFTPLLEKKIRDYFLCSKEEVPNVVDILDAQGVDIAAIKAFFGVQEGGNNVGRKRATSKGRKGANTKKVRAKRKSKNSKYKRSG